MEKELVDSEANLNKSIGYHRDQNNFSQLYRVDGNGKLANIAVFIN